MYGPDIQNIIFDLGGVLLDLDVSKTMKAFAVLGNTPVEVVNERVAESSFFNEYEKGLLSDTVFRDRLRALLKSNVSDGEIDAAWNAMLGPLPVERLLVLEKLKKYHSVFLLSNTNNIHLQAFNKIIETSHGHKDLKPFFHKDYYSHLLNMRKPDVEIFQHVLDDNELIAGNTLFLDDNVNNLRGAEKAGIKTIHIPHPDLILSIFA